MKKYLFLAVPCLLSAVCYGQGILPPQSSTVTVQGPILIGSSVPKTLDVIDANGKKRTLLSYKSALELLVVGFFSADCAESEQRWIQLRHMVEDYEGWRVAFVAINTGASPEALEGLISKAKLKIPVLREDDHNAVRNLLIEKTPTLAIFDESGDLRYRGPISKDARTAIEAMIGHTDPVPKPEPDEPGGCPILK